MNKQRLFYRLVIAALYLGAFEQLIRGMVRSVAPGLEILVVMTFEPVIYVVPLLLAWHGSIDRRFVLFLGVIILLVLFYPLRIQGDVLSYLLGFKFYFACLFYIPVIRYLSTFPGFEKKFLKHFSYILAAYALWAAIELLSSMYFKSIDIRMKSLMFNFEAISVTMNIPGYEGSGRPVGMGLDYQTGALALALYCIIFLLQRRYIWYLLLLILGFFVGFRTWFVATIVASALIMVTRLSLRKPHWILFVPVFLVGFYFKMEKHIEDFVKQFGDGGSGGIILNLFLNDGWFLFTHGGFFPNGFVRLSFSPIFGDALDNVAPQFLLNEVAVLRMHYEIGGIATLAWFTIMYYPFLKRGVTFYKNDYLVILFFSMIGFTHHLTIFKPFMFIFFIFCSIQASLKQQIPARERRPEPLGQSNILPSKAAGVAT